MLSHHLHLRLEIIQNLWLDLEPVATTNDIKW